MTDKYFILLLFIVILTNYNRSRIKRCLNLVNIEQETNVFKDEYLTDERKYL